MTQITVQIKDQDMPDFLAWLEAHGYPASSTLPDDDFLHAFPPSDDVLLARAQAGAAQIGAGNFKTEEEFSAIMASAKAKGLVKRAANGFGA